MSPAIKRLGVVGCGTISKKYFTAISRIDEAQVVAVADIDGNRAGEVAESMGIEGFPSSMEMASNATCDAFVVLTPSGDHVHQVLTLAPFGKPIIVEKPLSLRSVDAALMIEHAERYSCPLFVVKQNRSNPPIVWLKRAIDEGRIGKPVSAAVRVWWSRDQDYYNARKWRGSEAMDGGVLANQASHHIDMMLWLMGEAEAVSGMGARRICDIETEDTASVIVRFSSGAIGTIEATTATRPKDIEGSISILGDRGAVTVGGFYMNELKHWQFSDGRPEDSDIAEKWTTTPTAFAWGHEMYLREVLGSIFSATAGGVNAREAMKTVRFVEAARKSMNSGQVELVANK